MHVSALTSSSVAAGRSLPTSSLHTRMPESVVGYVLPLDLLRSEPGPRRRSRQLPSSRNIAGPVVRPITARPRPSRDAHDFLLSNTASGVTKHNAAPEQHVAAVRARIGVNGMWIL